ncbi:MAG: 2'-5'-RNA ligase [Candidatus Dependentiae bacterium ADurb.Bin331]|nr:MAG: 2'-5'-RNA ligase [Candidatus Dependentiae bacterium ADurb.Bin331]
MRLFVSIELPKTVRTRFESLEKEMKQYHFFEGRFVTPENIHLTLAFIGNVGNDQLLQIKTILSSIVFAPFEICVSSLTLKPATENAHLLWVEALSLQLSLFAQTMNDVLRDFVKTDDRPYAGHVTIARIKKITDFHGLTTFVRNSGSLNECFAVTEFTLRSSVLSANGPEYTTIATYQLRA